MYNLTVESIVRIFTTILSHGITLYALSRPSPSIKHPKTVWLIFSIAIFVFSAVLFYFTGSGFFSFGTLMIIMIVLYTVMFIATSSYPMLESLFLSMCNVISFMLYVLLANYLSVLLFHGTFWSNVIIRNFFSFLGLLLILKIKDPLIIPISNNRKGWGNLLLFICVAGFIVSCVSLVSIFIPSLIIQFVAFVSMLILMGASFVVVFVFIKLMNDTERIENMKANQKLLDSELLYLKKYADSSSRQISDMHNHNLRLLETLGRGDVQAAISYLQAYDESTIVSGTWCLNKTANALLRIYAGRCEENGIAYQFKIRISEELPISDPEFTVIFGNILENAYEAAKLTSKPFINVSMMSTASLFLAEIRNSEKGPVIWNGQLPYTTKSGGGIGLRSVQMIVEKHDGIMGCSDLGNVFVTRITFPLKENA